MYMKKVKIQIKSTVGSVLFEWKSKNNNIAKTLIKAISSSADLRFANLSEADLSYADLRFADLSYANLSFANLSDADLRFADLSYADLRSADLRFADLSDAKNTELAIARTRILPEGDLIGYKKCADDVIVKLKIPQDAKRSHALGRKCRAEFAEVLEIYGSKKAVSRHNPTFTYELGKIVKPEEPFSEDWTNECASGIHFFITKIEAENY